MFVHYDYYRVFYFAASCGSFTRAAEALLSTQPNVTRAVQSLESALGCRLFVRSRRGVRLTPEGEKLYQRVSAAFEQLEMAEKELSCGKDAAGGLLSIAASETALYGLLLPVLGRFHRLYPNIRLKVTNHSTPEAVEALSGRTADLAVVTTPVEGSRDFNIVRVKAFHDLLIGGSDFAALADKKLNIAEISALPLVSLAKGTVTHDYYARLFAACGAAYRPDVQVATNDQMLPMIRQNLGVGFLPEFFAGDAARDNTICRLSLSHALPPRHICLVTPANAPLSRAAEALKSMLLEP